LQDDLKKFISEPQPPPSGIEIPKEGKAKDKERREVGAGDDTVIVELKVSETMPQEVRCLD
jgi:hypothetical protein